MGNDTTTRKVVKEILHDGFYYDVTDWVKRHPGGSIIDFYTKPGEDASIAVKQFHQKSEKRVTAIMKSLKKRPANEVETNGKFSPEVVAQHKALTDDYMTLYEDLLKEGFFKGSKIHAFLRVFEIYLFYLLITFLSKTEIPYIWIVQMFLLSLGGTRNAYLVHEFGHRSMTGNVKVDRFVQSVVAGLNGGGSAAYWDYMHNRHHAFPQRMKHDVDLETLPLIAFNKKVITDENTAKSFLIRNQAYLFLTIDTFLVTLFWKYYLHPKYALHKGNYLELLFMVLSHYYVYLAGVPFFFICTWLGSLILFSNFSLNHTHTPVTDAEQTLHWVQYSFEHTVNITPSFLCDYWMGSLNYQIEHHLFPQIPHFRLHKIIPRVKAFAEKHGLPYRCLSYPEAFKKSLANLHQVSKHTKVE